ncbi:MAG: phosphotransferase [Defluviitaleaceae bacterium]|nr:phosphotransferase [Defluviitaleaceae bacterium]
MMKIDKIFIDMADELNLGGIIASVEPVLGGYMHKMYSLETTGGKYAVKLLNPAVMTRPDIFDNYKIAEDLERKLQNADIPIVPALEFGGKKMQYIDGQYFYVFEWVDGAATESKKVTEAHCEIIGAIVAKIHKVEQTETPSKGFTIDIDWDCFIELSKEKCPEITGLLTDNRELLYATQQDGNAALKGLSNLSCICHMDMDVKNVLWVGGLPKIIDLECLWYENPHLNLFQLTLDWCGYMHNDVDFGLLRVFMNAYIREYGEIGADWEMLYNSNLGIFMWLEYNTKRALGIECKDEEERQLGINMVKYSIERLIYYNSIKHDLLRELNTL